jgi:hypothetical protein
MELSQAKGLSLAANARMLAELNLAMADAAIVAWDAKYLYETWRPVTAIHDAADDGNSQTAPDPLWQPLLITPPFPEYVIGPFHLQRRRIQSARRGFRRTNLFLDDGTWTARREPLFHELR